MVDLYERPDHSSAPRINAKSPFSSKATGGGDYGGKTSGTITFAKGAKRKTITIPIWPNSTSEGDETFTITLSGLNGAGVTIIRTTATATIYGGWT